MAVIDPKKLLPSSNKSENSEKFLVPMSSIVLKKNVAISSRLLKPEAPKDEGKGGAIVPNKLVDKIVKVESILKSNLASQISQQNKKEREQKQKEAEEREKKLEIKPESKGKVPLPSLPRIGFLDALRNYFINTLLGFIAVKLFDMAPKLIKFLDAIKPVAGFIGEFAGNLFNGLVEFVDKGYKAYDQVQKFVKSVGGENAEKLFNDFSKNLNLVLNGAIIASMIAISTAPKGSRGGFSTPKGGTPKPVRTPTGYRAPEGVSRYLREDRVAQFGPRQKGFGERLSQRQRIAQQKLIQRPLRNLTRPARQLSGKVLNTGAGKLAGKIFGRIPIIGGLIDFAFNLAMGENPGRAAAKAVGSTLGAALGTFIPIPFAGTILGGILGDLVGGALYDTLVGSKPQKVQGKAQGGVVSSGRGKTPPRRGIKVQRAKPRRIVTQRTQPGKDIGGVKKIEELYGEDQPGTRSALRALKKSSEDVKRMRSLNGLSGAMFGAGIDMALGQKPDKNLSASLGSMFGAVIQTAIDSELNNTFGDITKTIAMAGGGVVPSRELKSNMSIGERIGRYISSALAVSIESSASKILQNLNKELRLEGGPAGETPGGDGAGGGAGPMVSSDSADFWLLSLISLYEGSNPQGAADVAQSIYNRMGYNGKSARENILAKNQYQPVRDFGGYSAWGQVVDKESALAHIKKYPGNGASASGLEKVAAALLDSSKQKSAAIFVGNRPDFRSDNYERSNDEMTDDASRNGQTFGFNRGSAYKGKSFVAQRIPSLVRGTVSQPVASGNVLSKQQTVVVEGDFRLRQDAAQAYLAMKDAAKKDGINLTLESAWRDSAKQKILYERYLAGKGNLAAPPGSSNHEKGIAIDLRNGIPWAQKNSSKFGWRNTGMTFSQKEPWHFDYVGGFVVKDKKDISDLYQIESKNKPSIIPQSDKNKPSPIFNFNTQASIQTPTSSSTSQEVAFLGNFSTDKTGISNISQSVSNFSESSDGPSSSTLAIQEIHYIYS